MTLSKSGQRRTQFYGQAVPLPFSGDTAKSIFSLCSLFRCAHSEVRFLTQFVVLVSSTDFVKYLVKNTWGMMLQSYRMESDISMSRLTHSLQQFCILGAVSSQEQSPEIAKLSTNAAFENFVAHGIREKLKVKQIFFFFSFFRTVSKFNVMNTLTLSVHAGLFGVSKTRLCKNYTHALLFIRCPESIHDAKEMTHRSVL